MAHASSVACCTVGRPPGCRDWVACPGTGSAVLGRYLLGCSDWGREGGRDCGDYFSRRAKRQVQVGSLAASLPSRPAFCVLHCSSLLPSSAPPIGSPSPCPRRACPPELDQAGPVRCRPLSQPLAIATGLCCRSCLPSSFALATLACFGIRLASRSVSPQPARINKYLVIRCKDLKNMQ